MDRQQLTTSKTNMSAPFTADESIVRKFGNTTYIINAKYKQGSSVGLADKLLHMIEDYNYDGKLY